MTAADAPQNRAWRVSATRRIEYRVLEQPDLFNPANPSLLACGRVRGARRFVVVDEQVALFHGGRIRDYFDHHGVEARLAVIPGGEANKTMGITLHVLRMLDAFPVHRRDEPIIAVGGGVVTDLAAFAAAMHRRGVPHLRVPSTLMGYVDASVGIKAGVNFNGCKNRLGAFEPPCQVLLDRTLLKTVSRRHLLNGVCEIIKLAAIADGALFALLESEGARAVDSHFQGEAGGAILRRAIDGMLRELEPNLFEEELARKVDFGHTFSYGLEARHPEYLLHGEAVLLDILVSAVLAVARGLLPPDDARRLFALVRALGMAPATRLLEAGLMWSSLSDRVTHRNGRQSVPLPAGIGHCVFVNDITREELDHAILGLHEWMATSDDRIPEC